MKKWNLIVDVARCHNCNNCTLATKDEHVGNDFPGYAAAQPAHGHRWISIQRKVRGEGEMVDIAYKPTMCNHCDDAPCMKNANGAIKKRADGIVIIDPQAAKGRKDLVAACPYGAISWNEEAQLPQAWIFDAHLLDNGWTVPRCVQGCATGALRALKITDVEMAELAKRENLEVDRPELDTRPRVHYRNLFRFNKTFIGGSVIANLNGLNECIEGAQVKLIRNSDVVATTATDAYGDFKFDRLPESNDTYAIEITHPEHGTARLDTQLNPTGRYIGTVALSATA